LAIAEESMGNADKKTSGGYVVLDVPLVNG